MNHKINGWKELTAKQKNEDKTIINFININGENFLKQKYNIEFVPLYQLIDENFNYVTTNSVRPDNIIFDKVLDKLRNKKYSYKNAVIESKNELNLK